MAALFRKLPYLLRLVILFLTYSFNLSLFFGFGWLCIKPFGFGTLEFFSRIPQTPAEINALLFMQAICSIGSFLFTALVFAQLESANPHNHLRINTGFPLKMLILGIISVLAAQFFLDFLTSINGKIPLPGQLGFLKGDEKRNADLTNAFLGFKQFGQFVIVSMVMAVLPAICEEFFFRGILLGDLLKEKVNPAVAIVTSGLIFALTHMEFQNTLAIWALGIFLGYLYYISGSIWLPVAAHFTNNILVVLLKYLYNIGLIKQDLTDATTPAYLTIAGIIIFAVCIFILNRWKEPADFEYDEIAVEEEPVNF